MRLIELRVEGATAAALAPFGQILGRGSGVVPTDVDFYGGAVALSYPIGFRCDHPVELSLATLVRRPNEVRYLERHFQHTQTFIPLGGKPFVVVMAPATESDLPDVTTVRAFRFDGSEGFAMDLGTWHEFPFAIEDNTDLVVVLSSQTGYDLKSKNAETHEAFGPDLDKKDIATRTQTLFWFDIQA